MLTPLSVSVQLEMLKDSEICFEQAPRFKPLKDHHYTSMNLFGPNEIVTDGFLSFSFSGAAVSPPTFPSISSVLSDISVEN